MLEFVNSGLSFVQDEYNFVNPLLQGGSGSGEKSRDEDQDPVGSVDFWPAGSYL